MFKSKPRPEGPPDPIDWQDSRYLSAVGGRIMASHFCTFSATTSLMVGIYATGQAVWPIAGLMLTGALTGCLFAFGCASRAYQWQKHDRIRRRESEANEREAIQENGRMWREQNVFVLREFQRVTELVEANRAGDEGGVDHESSPPSDDDFVLFMNPRNGRRH